jgi:hypothetical protein
MAKADTSTNSLEVDTEARKVNKNRHHKRVSLMGTAGSIPKIKPKKSTRKTAPTKAIVR